MHCLVNATELWAPERPDTETVYFKQSIHEHLTLNTHHYYTIIYSPHILFFHFKFARQTSHIIVCIVYCVFAILYIAYLYFIILLSVLLLLFCCTVEILSL